MPDDPKKDPKKTLEENNAAIDRLKKFGKRSAKDAENTLDIAKRDPKPKKS